MEARTQAGHLVPELVRTARSVRAALTSQLGALWATPPFPVSIRQNVVMGDVSCCWASQRELSVLEGGHWQQRELGSTLALVLWPPPSALC
jgi:hypothetical protein